MISESINGEFARVLGTYTFRNDYLKPVLDSRALALYLPKPDRMLIKP